MKRTSGKRLFPISRSRHCHAAEQRTLLLETHAHVVFTPSDSHQGGGAGVVVCGNIAGVDRIRKCLACNLVLLSTLLEILKTNTKDSNKTQTHNAEATRRQHTG